jgi:hypothetical protein
MNENQQNFDQLQRLLKLKQHEVPSPGYFNAFSDQIMSRIRAGEAGEAGQGGSLMDRLEYQAPWLVNFIRVFETRPGLVGAFATSLCLLLVLGVFFAEYSERTAQQVLEIAETPGQTASPSLATLATLAPAASVSASGGIVASTNPVTSLQPVATMFGHPGGNSLFQSAGFAPAR